MPTKLTAQCRQNPVAEFDFVTRADAPQATLQDAVALAQQSIPLLEEGAGAVQDRARLYFWSAIVWGARAQRVGLLTIVREGVANRMHEYAERSLALDPSVDRGGALRLLSRLHGDLPRVPFVTSWVDRDRSLPLAERAFAIDPEHPGNRLILALALLERVPERTDEAVALLESVAQSEAQPAMLVESLAIQTQAIEKLQSLEPGAR